MTAPAVAGSLLRTHVAELDTVHGPFAAHCFHNLTTGQPAVAVVRGDPRGDAPLLARVHSSCITSEAYGACDCDCAEQLDAALARIAAEGRGILFYLTQEGRGAGFAAKARDRMLVQASGNRLTTFEAYDRLGLAHDQRRYDDVGLAAALVGATAPLVLLTNNPEKLTSLRDAGVAVAGHAPLAIPAQPYSRHYLDAKSRSGHVLDAAAGANAELPEPVVAEAPQAIGPDCLRLATYLLPIRTPAPAWFRLHLYFDLVRRRERVVLTHGDPARTEPLLHVHHERLFERFPLRAPAQRRRWQEAAAAMVRHGSGATLVVDGDREPDATALGLLAAHVPGGRARPIWPPAPAVVGGLAAHGLALGEPVAAP
jgi:3,4-dihydroxy 2-butanone 4-phosphate synthase/GTP cyclohydrolase II